MCSHSSAHHVTCHICSPPASHDSTPCGVCPTINTASLVLSSSVKCVGGGGVICVDHNKCPKPSPQECPHGTMLIVEPVCCHTLSHNFLLRFSSTTSGASYQTFLCLMLQIGIKPPTSQPPMSWPMLIVNTSQHIMWLWQNTWYIYNDFSIL